MGRAWAAAAILALQSVSLAQQKGPPTPVGPPVRAGATADDATCQRHGTAVEFHSTPSAAAAAARKAEKLVLVLHVSGHFEDPGFT